MEKDFDLGILTIFDPTPIKVEEIQKQAEQNIVELYSKLSQIKQEKDLQNNDKPDELQRHDFDKGVYEIDLPEPRFIFPRQKPLPKEKPLSKWEKFAKEKGIKKKKQPYKTFDEDLGEYVPRWGPYSAKKQKDKNDFIREVKQGEDPYEDPFKREKLQKKLATETQKMGEIKNKLTAKGHYARGILNQATSEKAAQRKQKTQGIKQKNKRTLSVAQGSTASMGNFDKKSHRDEKQIKSKKRKVLPSFKNAKEENKRDQDMLQFIQNNKGNKKVKV